MIHLDIEELDSKFEILAKLGEGGMGAVYKARHKVLDRLRVIKTIRPQLQHDLDLQNRFLREAQVAAELRHPNIAAVHDCAFTANGTAYIVMEHIEGQNIREYLRSGGRLTLEHVISIGRQALAALGYLHEKQFVHRDISTDNLMLTWQNGLPHVTLIDLGLAKSLETSQWHTKTGMVVGKVRYISPEQLNAGVEGNDIDARSDLYSMGVVLYELLTGQYPITGQDDMSLIAGHLYRPPRSFDETDPQAKIPTALRAVVMKALEKKPEFRWQTARDFAEGLRTAFEMSSHAERQMTPEQQRALRTGTGTEALVPGMLPRDPNMPTVTVDMPVPYAPGQVSVLQAPRTQVDLSTQPIDSEAVTAPITSPMPPRPPGHPAAAPPVAAAPSAVDGRRRLVVAALALTPLLALGGYFALRPTPEPGPGPSGKTPDSRGPEFFGSYHALVIGNDNYQRLPKLESAVRDAQTLGDLLERRYGFKVTRVLDGNRGQIIDAIYEQIEQRTQRDNLLIFFAGHGRIEGDRAYWLPTDANPDRTTDWLSTSSEINPLLNKIQARHLLVVADSCYAGAMIQGGPLASAAEPGLPRDEALSRMVSSRSRLVLTSGGVTPVLDSAQNGHSIFATALFDELEANKETLEISRVFAQIRGEVKKRSAAAGLEQEPVLAVLPNSDDEGGELVFLPKKSG